MASKKCHQKTRVVHRRYEPDRLSPARLAEAYEKVVPRYVRILDEWLNEMETKPDHERLRIGG
jgi:hypothetical protein